jgi:hypothetical protein
MRPGYLRAILGAILTGVSLCSYFMPQSWTPPLVRFVSRRGDVYSRA